MIPHTITFSLDGTASCLWTEAVPLHELGRLEVHRASMVEFNGDTQLWEVRLVSSPDIVAFSHASRGACLEWECRYFNRDLPGKSEPNDENNPGC